MRHVIKTQVIDLVTDNQSEAFGLQHRMSAIFYQHILPVLEKTFNELSPGEDLVQIDRLELDLGFIGSEAFNKQQFPLQLHDQLYKQLKEVLITRQAKQKPVALQIGIARQWLYYMQHGYLPWNAGKINEGWYGHVLKAFATDHAAIQLLRALVRNNSKALVRIVRLHDSEFLIHLIETLSAKNQERLNEIVERIAETVYPRHYANQSSLEFIKLRRIVWEAVIFYAATNESVSDNEIIAMAVIPKLQLQEIELLIRHLPVNKLLAAFEQPLRKRQKELAILPRSAEKKTGEEKNSITINTKDSLPEGGIFTANAGIVILHPFLEYFFRSLDLLENNVFVNENCRQKALSLLQYLVTGAEKGNECDWVMAKILCGVPLDEPIEPEILLTDNEKQEADELLAEVIARWAILKNTSVAALRETFLQRPGKLLAEKTEEIRLQVELGPMDVLMQYLPWSISIIRFGWMPKILKVEWQ